MYAAYILQRTGPENTTLRNDALTMLCGRSALIARLSPPPEGFGIDQWAKILEEAAIDAAEAFSATANEE